MGTLYLLSWLQPGQFRNQIADPRHQGRSQTAEDQEAQGWPGHSSGVVPTAFINSFKGEGCLVTGRLQSSWSA